MNTRQNVKSGSTIAQQLSSVNLSQHERNAALHDAYIAELIVDAIVWIGSKMQRPNAGVFANPSPKY